MKMDTRKISDIMDGIMDKKYRGITKVQGAGNRVKYFECYGLQLTEITGETCNYITWGSIPW